RGSAMSVAMDVEEEIGGEYEADDEGETHEAHETQEAEARSDAAPTSMLPAPTYPAAMLAEYQGGDDVPLTPYGGGSRAEAPDNKKPFLLVRLGHRLCGFSR
ncbi:MAG TPA: hypothetical protein VMZ51_06935, partial [Acidimicrobiales bacterium]|nr:hypothetical protein [Acidimicrobiales bacterium]